MFQTTNQTLQDPPSFSLESPSKAGARGYRPHLGLRDCLHGAFREDSGRSGCNMFSRNVQEEIMIHHGYSWLFMAIHDKSWLFMASIFALTCRLVDWSIGRWASETCFDPANPLGIDPSHFLLLFPGKVGKAVVGCSCNVVSLAGWWTSRSAKYCKVRYSEVYFDVPQNCALLDIVEK